MSSVEPANSAPEHFLTLIRQQQRGRLKIYLGFAAGVGKTYEMLQEGQRLKARGVDVIIGIVETHGRAETAAQAVPLEQAPRRKIEYRGVVLEEMDLDAILARRPAIVLVDELAHTNAPGSRYDNWRLSTDRANATRLVMVEAGIDPQLLESVIGLADTDPLVKDNPLDARNRRISIILYRRGKGISEMSAE